jgi:hypothetical protein
MIWLDTISMKLLELQEQEFLKITINLLSESCTISINYTTKIIDLNGVFI